MDSKKEKNNCGGSYDALLLTFIKFLTIGISLIITRLLSEYLSLHDYGTYSQILLLTSLISSMTIFGMMDGINYFYCSEKDNQKRDEYVSTIFSIQCIIGVLIGSLVFLFCTPLCVYFDNPDLDRLLVFAAIIPLLQNILSLIQILLISIGKARILAVRNFFISLIRLIVVLGVVTLIRKVWVIFVATIVLDIIQIVVFVHILFRNHCRIRIKNIRYRLIGEILKYCAPMAVFLLINSLSRDMDKYFISLMTDTNTLAIYSNASKQLPFDIILTSFCTVLIPYITKYIADKNMRNAANLYKSLLEVGYITTGFLCCTAVTVAPQLMTLLYSEKYINGLPIFVIYLFVDLFRFTNITLVLSAAGKTKTLMLLGVVSLGCNAILNMMLYHFCDIIGPAIATLIITIVVGLIMLTISAHVLKINIRCLFDIKYIITYSVENIILIFILTLIRQKLEIVQMNYILIMFVISLIYGCVMITLNGKRLLGLLSNVNNNTMNKLSHKC